METLPSIWRTEIFHPLIAHFPVVLLLLGSVVLLAHYSPLWPERKAETGFLLRVLLILGTLAAWAAVITGNMAYHEVGRDLCDPNVVHTHETFAKITSIAFSLMTLAELFRARLGADLQKLFTVLSVILALGVLAGISYTGHKGAVLVYQQAAGVHVPSEDCAEFE